MARPYTADEIELLIGDRQLHYVSRMISDKTARQLADARKRMRYVIRAPASAEELEQIARGVYRLPGRTSTFINRERVKLGLGVRYKDVRKNQRQILENKINNVLRCELTDSQRKRIVGAAIFLTTKRKWPLLRAIGWARKGVLEPEWAL